MTAEKAEGATGFAGFDPKSVEPYIVKDPESLAINMARRQSSSESRFRMARPPRSGREDG